MSRYHDIYPNRSTGLFKGDKLVAHGDVGPWLLAKQKELDAEIGYTAWDRASGFTIRVDEDLRPYVTKEWMREMNNDGPVHELKTWHEPFDAVWEGKKFHELRKNDRGFTTNDLLILREYHAPLQRYSGRTIFAVPTYITRVGAFGLPDDMVVMSIRVIAKNKDWHP